MVNHVIRLPDIGEGVTEAEIVEWYVKPGDSVVADQNLLDVMTDKATVETPSPATGRVTAIHGDIGDVIPVGSVLVELEIEGQAVSGGTVDTGHESPSSIESPSADSEPLTVSQETKTVDESKAQLAVIGSETEQDVLAITTRPQGESALAAPATRRRAYELGVPLQFVPGTGPGGRITAADLDRYISAKNSGAAAAPGESRAKRTGIRQIKIIGMRRKIAERMQDAKSRIPHFSYVEQFDLTNLEELRKSLNSQRREVQPKLTLLPFFMRALILLQPEFPSINSRYDDEQNLLESYEGVHIGIATQTDTGLMVPVVRHAESRNLWDCAEELLRVTSAARQGRATREELSGSTITLTSLGVLGGISATPVINSPEVAIIGPNKLVETPVVRDGQIVIRTMMNVSSSFDHRIVDGYEAARFIQRLKQIIETPAHLFLERS